MLAEINISCRVFFSFFKAALWNELNLSLISVSDFDKCKELCMPLPASYLCWFSSLTLCNLLLRCHGGNILPVYSVSVNLFVRILGAKLAKTESDLIRKCLEVFVHFYWLRSVSIFICCLWIIRLNRFIWFNEIL